jgi:hypothetical protein
MAPKPILCNISCCTNWRSCLMHHKEHSPKVLVSNMVNSKASKIWTWNVHLWSELSSKNSLNPWVLIHPASSYTDPRDDSNSSRHRFLTASCLSLTDLTVLHCFEPFDSRLLHKGMANTRSWHAKDLRPVKTNNYGALDFPRPSTQDWLHKIPRATQIQWIIPAI